jgi:transcriptional regulator with XRE-family HTH domain
MAKVKSPRSGGGRPQPEELGLVEQLRDAIRSSGESLNHLGARAGVGRDRLSRFMRAERGLTLDAAEKLCRALGLRLTRGESASTATHPEGQ